MPVLAPEQVAGFLRDNPRSPESLLGAFHASRDNAQLQEAKEQFPDDPRVEFVAATESPSPEERRKWIDALKQSAPDNALANYLSAAEYFKAGQTGPALQEVQAAVNKSIQDYQLNALQNAEEAYRSAGYSEADARTIASVDLLLPDLGAYKNVGYGLADLANSYWQAGDTTSAQASLQLALDLAQRLNVPAPLTMIQTMVALAIEQKALGAMDPNAVDGGGNQTVQSQLAAVTQQRDSILALNQQWAALLPRITDQDVVNFFQREWSFGEQVAEQWVVNKYAQPPGNSQP